MFRTKGDIGGINNLSIGLVVGRISKYYDNICYKNSFIIEIGNDGQYMEIILVIMKIYVY